MFFPHQTVANISIDTELIEIFIIVVVFFSIKMKIIIYRIPLRESIFFYKTNARFHFFSDLAFILFCSSNDAYYCVSYVKIVSIEPPIIKS